MRIVILITLFMFSASVTAQTSQAGLPPPPPLPPNNLGQGQLPTVIYPDNSQIAEEMIQELEGLQLTPEQVSRVKQLYLQREMNKATPYATPPNPVTRTLAVNLEPGIAPPLLRLSRGQQSSIVFSDANGNPWFIKKVSLNRQAFNDGKNGSDKDEESTNVLSLEPLNPMAYGNVSVTLNGLSTPVIFTLTSGQSDVDVRVDAKIPGYNPDAGHSVSVTSLPTIDGELVYFMDGVPPKEAKRLNVRGLDGTTAWDYGGNLYLRTRASAQFPAYRNAARSTSGISVYRYEGLYDTVTLLTGGRAVTVFVE